MFVRESSRYLTPSAPTTDAPSLGRSNVDGRAPADDGRAAPGRRGRRPDECLAGWAPLPHYLFGLVPAFRFSTLFTGLAFFGAGASRAPVTDRRWIDNGGEVFLVGTAAATLAFVAWTLLEGLA